MRRGAMLLRPCACRIAALLASGPLLAAEGAAQDQIAAPATSASRIEASQIELPASAATAAGQGRAYLDEAGRPLAPPAPRANLIASPAPPLSPAESAVPTPQIVSTSERGSPGMAQLSQADLVATLAQLSPSERQVLFEAIAGSDICDAPPQIAAVIALCQNRIETHAADFGGRAESPVSAEDRLLRGDLESSTLPNIARVIERLARGGASSGDLSNQAIAAIALGTNSAALDRAVDKDPAAHPQPGEQAQELINALVNQLGGNAP